MLENDYLRKMVNGFFIYVTTLPFVALSNDKRDANNREQRPMNMFRFGLHLLLRSATSFFALDGLQTDGLNMKEKQKLKSCETSEKQDRNSRKNTKNAKMEMPTSPR